jgi:hypothetical protein
MQVVYRTLYRLVDSPLASMTLVGGARLLAAVTGSTTEGWLSAFDRRFVRSGWPGHGTNWINQHASRLLSHAWRRHRRAPAPKPPRVMTRRQPVRVGIIGRFVGLLGFPPDLFAACPATMQLTLFDIPYGGKRAEYLRELASAYVPVELDDYGPRTDEAARAIAAADLDLLVNVNWKADAHALLDVIDTRCVANYCVGSELLNHPRVDIELLWQVQADNDIRDHRLWCSGTSLPLGQTFVYQVSGLYDARGLSNAPLRSWHEREPLIVSHGSLYKFAVPEFVGCMLDVLERATEARWVLVGKDNGRALAAIQAAAAQRGMQHRVQYEGEFSSVRDADGRVSDPRWAYVQTLLQRARLAPDPFPIGSGSARFEAYLLGAPSVHMGIRGRGSKPIASCDLPVLSVPAATAETIDEYRALSGRCLSDPEFATMIQEQQLAAAQRASDATRWWAELDAAYRAWYDVRTAA